MTPVIEFKNATLGYGRKVILRDLTFAIHAGEYFGLVGPNGAGKTTILRAILGMIKPLAGTISLGGSNGTKPRFGYVPQRDTIDYILPYSVLEVVMMGRYRHIGMFHAPNDGDRDVVVRSLSHVGVQDLRDLPFKDLSGGQKQRVLIARALATEPRILILDEPTNGMDLSSRTSILDLISTLHEEGQLTVIMVSHLLDDVANHVQQMAIVEHDQFQVGRVEEVLTAGNLSALYQMPVVVEDIGGSKFVLTGGRRGAS